MKDPQLVKKFFLRRKIAKLEALAERADYWSPAAFAEWRRLNDILADLEAGLTV